MYYTEDELRGLLNILITVGQLFHRNNLVHGDFRAHNVLIDEEDKYKIVDYAALGLEYS